MADVYFFAAYPTLTGDPIPQLLNKTASRFFRLLRVFLPVLAIRSVLQTGLANRTMHRALSLTFNISHATAHFRKTALRPGSAYTFPTD